MAELEMPTIPCKYCGEPTVMLGTRQCNNCWEVSSRIGYSDFRAPLRKMLAELDLTLMPLELHQAPRFSSEIKEIAYQLDAECWVSYSGKPKKFKQAMEARRIKSLEQAEKVSKI